MRTLLTRLSVITVLATALGCSSASQNNGPEWTRQAARTVDGGYIVYVGSGEDRMADKSHFKSEGMALQDLANECSFAPKGTRVEDHFDEQTDTGYRSFTKIGIQFDDCETAKKAVTPEQIRDLANAQLTDEIKRYQQLVDGPEPQEAAPIAANGAPPPPVNSSAEYVVVRQQIAFEKEVVILAPPTYYPPVVMVQPMPSVVYASQSAAAYEHVHPEIRTAPFAFSNQRPNWTAHQAPALREMRPMSQSMSRPMQNAYNRPNMNRPRSTHRPPGQNNRQKRRRKQNER